MVEQRPAGRDRFGLPGGGGQVADERVELRLDEVVLVAEAGVVRGARVVDEWIALDLAGAQLLGPRLEDGEVVDVVAAEDHVHPAPRGVLPDPFRAELADELEQAGTGVRPTRLDGRGRHRRPRRAASLVVAVEVAAVVVVVARPGAVAMAAPT